jgi:hypothetical protein
MEQGMQERLAKARSRKQTPPGKKEYAAPVLHKREKLSEIARGGRKE